jgi:putative membrane protein
MKNLPVLTCNVFPITHEVLFLCSVSLRTSGHVLCLANFLVTAVRRCRCSSNLFANYITVAPARYVEALTTVHNMNTSQHGLGGREFIIAILAALVLGACTTRKNKARSRALKLLHRRNSCNNMRGERSLKPAAAHSSSRHLTTSHRMRSSDNGNAASHNENAAEGNTAAVLSQIHQANMTEIAVGKLAEDKASTPEVRAYADQLIHDHTMVDRMIAAMAQKMGTHLRDQIVSLREGRRDVPSAAHSEQKLSSASGFNFDELFLEQAGSDHQRLIQKLQRDREDTNDDELEALIDKIVPISEQHRELATILIKKERA